MCFLWLHGYAILESLYLQGFTGVSKCQKAKVTDGYVGYNAVFITSAKTNQIAIMHWYKAIQIQIIR